MDQQYMQQSSQLYVFTTEWANKAAEALRQQQHPSIVSWHESQPETKKHLEVRVQLNTFSDYTELHVIFYLSDVCLAPFEPLWFKQALVLHILGN